MTRHLVLLLALGLAGIALPACRPGTPTSPETDSAATCQAAAAELANLTYTIELVDSGSVQLEAGEYRAPAAPGSATEVLVQLTDHVACGDLNGISSAAAVLVSSAGGSGTFYSLHAVQPLDGTPAEVAYAMLGDRVKVEGVAIEDNLIFVDLITHAADDPLCCPTEAVVEAYALDGTELRLVSTTPKTGP